MPYSETEKNVKKFPQMLDYQGIHVFLFGCKTKSPSSSKNVQGDILFGEIPNDDHQFSRISKSE